MPNRRLFRTATSVCSRRLRVGRRLSVVAMAVSTMAILGAQTGAQSPRQDAASQERYPNFDIRRETPKEMSEYMEKHAAVRNADLVASMVDARAQAFAQLGASGKRLAVVNSETLGSVEVLGIEGRGVLAEATADRVGTMRAFLAGYAGAYGLSTQQLAELELVADYVNPGRQHGMGGVRAAPQRPAVSSRDRFVAVSRQRANSRGRRAILRRLSTPEGWRPHHRCRLRRRSRAQRPMSAGTCRKRRSSRRRRLEAS